MKTSFSLSNFTLNQKTTDRLPKHDIVFGTPFHDQAAGMPIGDGSTGSLLWFGEDTLHINLNNTDLWDDSTWNDPVYCSKYTEDVTCVRHGGEIQIRFDMPVFDSIYQDEFDARLSLTDASVAIDAKTPFSHIKAHSFASSGSRVTALRMSVKSDEPTVPKISLVRWGSRNFWRWYSTFRHIPESGLGGTDASVTDERIYITQKLNGTEFCVGLAIVGKDKPNTELVNSRGGCFTLPKITDTEFTLFWNISIAESTEKAKKVCETALDTAIDAGYDALFKAHTDNWASFWNKSYIAIPDDYVENLAYLSLYYSNSECRGEYAPHFTNGIWGFVHDFVPWTYYFHYNMQHMFGPLEPTGHGELADNYYRMRRDGLDTAYKYAELVKGHKGAFFHDVTDRYGRGATYDSHNTTPTSQIAMAMWRHYRMNGDEKFLRESALPVMLGAAEYYFDILEKGDDGLYHTHDTTAYEGTPPFTDSITDKVMIRSLFTALRDLVPEDEKAKYTDVLEHLPDYNYVTIDDDEVADGKLLYGFGAGRDVLAGGKMLTVGIDKDGNPRRKNFGNPDSIFGGKSFYGFPDTEMSPLYPAGVMSLADKGTELYDVMINQINIHSLPEQCMNWCLMPIYMARLGMADDLIPYIRETISAWFPYFNGFSTDCQLGRADSVQRLLYNSPRLLEADNLRLSDTYHSMEAYRFRHYDMETLPIIAHAVCESLLQSYDGVIRVFPAVKAEDASAFCLYAEGGFKVSGDHNESGTVIAVESLRGEKFTVAVPEFFNKDTLTAYRRTHDGEVIMIHIPFTQVGNEKLLVLTDIIEKGETILIADCDISDFTEASPIHETANTKMKVCGNAQLGTPAVHP